MRSWLQKIFSELDYWFGDMGRFEIPIYGYILMLIMVLMYLGWLYSEYRNPPLACYLTRCHFTLLGWER